MEYRSIGFGGVFTFNNKAPIGKDEGDPILRLLRRPEGVQDSSQ